MRGDSRLLPAGLRVLLVEDEALIAMDSEAMLLSFGVASVDWARSVGDALRMIETNAFDAAILDLRLGEETSLPLAQRLDELGVPYGFLTGYRDDDIPEPFRQKPMVPKPFTAEQLSSLLRKLTGQRCPGQG